MVPLRRGSTGTRPFDRVLALILAGILTAACAHEGDGRGGEGDALAAEGTAETAAAPEAAAAPDPAGQAEPAPQEAVDAAVENLQEAPAPAAEPAPFEVKGRLSLDLRYRQREDEDDDLDLYAYLRLDGARAKDRDLSFHLYGRMAVDLDGDTGDGSSSFFSLNDLGGGALDLDLYEAWIDLEGPLAPDELGFDRIRLGRQRVDAGLSFLVDGARIDFDPIQAAGGLRIAVFGGVPEYLYERSRSGDWIAGIEAGFKPFATTNVDLRYVHVEDENGWVDRDGDDFLAAELRQQIGECLRVSVNWDTIGLDTRDVGLRLHADIDEGDLTIDASYFYQDEVTLEFTTPFDPFVGVLGTSFAYHQFQVQLTKLLGEHFAADLGASVRRLVDSGNDSPFNRDFERYWLTLSSRRWPTDELGLAVTAEYWNGDEDETLSAGGEVDWRPNDDLRLTLGSYYSLWKYDLFIVDERQDVATYFLRARWKVSDEFSLDGRYEFETGDEGDFHSLRVGFTWRF